jgi:hypothetical protein
MGLRRGRYLVTGVLGGAAAQSTLLTDLSSFWTLDEASGNRADSHGTNTLAETGTVTSAAGVHSNAGVFSNGNYLTCASDATLQTGDIDFTFAARIYPTTLTGTHIIAGKGNAADLATMEWAVYVEGTRVRFDLWQSSAARALYSDASITVEVDTWYDVIAWVNTVENKMHLEVNGVDETADRTKIPAALGGVLAVGAYGGGFFPFIGRIDDVTFAKRKWTTGERAEWRNSTYPFDGSAPQDPADLYDRANVTISGQATMYLVPTAPQNGTLVVYHHGVGENEDAWLADTLKDTVRDALLADGYILAGSNAHDENWGNAASVADYNALYADAAARFTLTKVMFLSQSMGGLSGLNCVVDSTIPVAGWAGIYPVCSLADMFANNAGAYAAAIRAAYGIAADGSDYAAKTAGCDPLLVAATEYTIPMRFYASAADTVVGKTANSDAMSAHVADNTPEESVVVCSGDHGDPSHFQPSDLIAFFERC